jgi:hypothetical protein
MKRRMRGWRVALTLLCSFVAAAALAEEAVAPCESTDEDLALAAAAVDDDVLGSARGQGNPAWLTLNDADAAAEVSGNQVTSSPTGDNRISETAFAEATGFTTVIQNTGNHVVIQDVTIINITVQ